MRRYLLSALVVMSFVLVLPFMYGGCGSDGGGGGPGPSPNPNPSPGPGPSPSPNPTPNPTPDPGGITIDADDIGGNVSSNGSPEAGVWVIAESDQVITSEQGPFGFRKIVVTDDDGNFVIPDLPEGTYDVWVRGYGLVDSSPVQVSPGELIDLEAVPAATPQEAAQIYPGNYWYSLLEPPSEDMFPGTMTEEDPGNGIPESHQTQGSWVNDIKLGCELCHQLGSFVTRSHPVPEQFDEIWQRAGNMNSTADGLGREVAMDVFGDWGARIADGEVPPEPPRPGTQIERGVVLTLWSWGDGITYLHDEVSTDKRDPTMYPNGKIWGADIGDERLLYVDPVTNEVGEYKVPFLPGYVDENCGAVSPLDCFTLPAYGEINGPHNPMLDDQGRVWLTTGIKPGTRGSEEAQPDFCTDGTRGDVPLPAAPGRELAYFDTNTEEFVLIQVCQRTHHLHFDKNGILWISSGGGGRAMYWFDPSKFDPNDPGGTEAQAQDWRDVQVDSDGDGTADTNIAASGARIGNGYGIIPNPVDGSVWFANPGYPGNIGRYDPATEKFEVYEPPLPGHGPRGIDVDKNGIIWTALGGSGHLARFDRSQCTQTYGTGGQCPEGWTLYETPGPQMKGVPDGPNDGSADFHYYMWVDQFNTSGLGENWVFVNGTGSDSVLAFDPEAEQFHILRVPYPQPFYQRGLDGRIDDPDASWKGRGLWVNNGNDPIKHNLENGGIGYLVNMQFRSSPLDH